MKYSLYRNPINIVYHQLRSNILLFLSVVLFIILKQIFSYKVTLLQKNLVDVFEITDTMFKESVFLKLSQMFIVYFFFLILAYNVENILIHYLSIKISIFTVNQAINNVQEQDYTFFKKKNAGVLNAYLSDLSNIKGFIRSFFYSITQTAAILISIYILFQINKYFSIFIIIWALITFLVFHQFNKISSKLSRSFSKSKAKINGYFSDICNQFITFLTSTNKDKEKAILNDIIINVYDRYKNIINLNIKRGVFITLVMLILIIAICILFYIGKIQNNILTMGEITTVLAASIKLFWDISTLVKQTSILSEEYGVLSQASKHLFYTSNNNEESKKHLLLNEPPEIEFKNVKFAHEEMNIFKNFSLKIKKGSKLGIVGKTGSGKTTLTYLLLKILSPQKGKILINNQSIEKYSSESIRNSIAFVSQNVEILSRSLKDNMLLNTPNESVTKEEFKKISDQSLCSEFAIHLSDKYGTKLGEKGTKLSGGQKQRISIARALFKKASIIIFDEATSALDNITEKAIQNNLETSFKNTTSIFIAHRLTTLVNMDEIVVMDKGEIIEQGTHAELIQNKKYYYKLWNSNDNI